jgi:hypothetical protein
LSCPTNCKQSVRKMVFVLGKEFIDLALEHVYVLFVCRLRLPHQKTRGLTRTFFVTEMGVSFASVLGVAHHGRHLHEKSEVERLANGHRIEISGALPFPMLPYVYIASSF